MAPETKHSAIMLPSRKKACKCAKDDVFFMSPSWRGGNRWTDTMSQTNQALGAYCPLDSSQVCWLLPSPSSSLYTFPAEASCPWARDAATVLSNQFTEGRNAWAHFECPKSMLIRCWTCFTWVIKRGRAEASLCHCWWTLMNALASFVLTIPPSNQYLHTPSQCYGVNMEGPSG